MPGRFVCQNCSKDFNHTPITFSTDNNFCCHDCAVEFTRKAEVLKASSEAAKTERVLSEKKITLVCTGCGKRREVTGEEALQLDPNVAFDGGEGWVLFSSVVRAFYSDSCKNKTYPQR
jgi:hypothetical protein